MSLTTAELGTTGMELTRVGFGAWAIGGDDWAVGWGPQDDDESVAAIHHAIARGSTGSTPPRSTASGTPRRSSGGR